MKPSKLVTLAMTLLLAAPAFTAGVSQSTIGAAYARINPAIVLVKYSLEVTNTASGQQSKHSRSALGVLVSSDGLVMTHGHMKMENSTPFNITITVGSGEEEEQYDAVLLPKPDDVNIVFLQIEDDEKVRLPYVKFSKGGNLGVGAPVGIFGLLPETLDHTTMIRENKVGAVLEKPRTTYALDDSVRFGFVGGPVIDTAGRAVGVVGFDLSSNEGGEVYTRSGHPLVYQTELFQQYIDNPPEEVEEEESEGDAWLGVFTQPLTADFTEYWGLMRDGGLIVSTVVPGSPAEAAGFRSGDVITTFDGTPIRAKVDRDVVGFTKLVRETGAGAEVDVRILRDGEAEIISLTLGLRPRAEQDAAEFEDEVFGLTIRELTTDARIRMNMSEDVNGVIVRSVESGSVAQVARVMPGTVIMRMNDMPIASIDDYKAAVEQLQEAKPSEVTVFARVGSVTGFFRFQPRWAAE